MSNKTLRTALERTYQLDLDTIPGPFPLWTIQGLSVGMVKDGDQTSSTIIFNGTPGEISQSQFMAAYGSEDPDFVYGLISQLANVGPQSKLPDVNGFKFGLAAVRGMAPRDPLDAMICAQMAMVHQISMMFAERLAKAAPYPLDMASEEQPFTRIVRTRCALTTAFERHRDVTDRNIARRDFIANGAHANGNALPKVESQTYLRVERSGQDGETNKVMMARQGSQDPDFASSLFGPLVNIGTRSGFTVDDGLKFVRAAVKGMAPQDPFEEQICAQVAVVHSVAMMFANRLGHAEDRAELASAEQSLTRLSRTFCALAEAIDRHREVADRKIARQRVSTAHGKGAVVNGSLLQNGIKQAGRSNGHASA